MRKPNKKVTFTFFDWKWSKVPKWAKATEHIYRNWYVERYGYKNVKGLERFLSDKSYILEAGCGLARDSKMFAELNPNAHIVAIDQSRHAVRVANSALKKFKNCKVIRADITNFFGTHYFDFISCDQVIHHTPDPGKTLLYLFGKLKKGGVINFSVCRKKNKARDLADDLIMEKAASFAPAELWKFSVAVTRFAKALHDLGILDVKFEGRRYENIQRFIHNNLFRAWYNPDISFDLSVSSNYDWFSGNPRYSAEEVKLKMFKKLNGRYKLLNFYEDDATISASLQKV